MSTSRQPDPLVQTTSHVLVGGAASFIMKEIFPRGGSTAVVVGFVVGVWAHAALDAPLAKAIAAATDL